jgi:hypothetical protein
MRRSVPELSFVVSGKGVELRCKAAVSYNIAEQLFFQVKQWISFAMPPPGNYH